MEFWLNPFGIGGTEFGFPQNGQGTPDKPNLANIMGIGGYQQVLKTTSTISPGKFETTIDAHYVYSGEQGGSTNYREKILSTCDNITDVDAPDEAEQNENNCNTAIRRAEFVASALATRGAIPNIDDVPVSTRPEGVDSEDTNLSKPEESIYNDRPVEASLNFGDTAAERAPPISRPDLGG